MIKFLLLMLVFIGIIFFPIFTLGMILCHYNHEVLGVIAIIYSLFNEGIDKKIKSWSENDL